MSTQLRIAVRAWMTGAHREVDLQFAAERVAFGQVAECQFLAEQIEAIVAAEPPEQRTGCAPAAVPVLRTPRLRLCPPKSLGVKPAPVACARMIRAAERRQPLRRHMVFNLHRAPNRRRRRGLIGGDLVSLNLRCSPFRSK
jgi:hypothetical protein